MSKIAEQKALEAYPYNRAYTDNDVEYDGNFCNRLPYIEGYEQAEKDIIAIVKEYLEKGLRCMEQEGESQLFAFWDGFHNCSENILRELKEK